MKLTTFCIKRPVFSTILSLIIITLGYVAFKQLQVRQYPKVDRPKVSILTQLEGAAPQIIEAQVTKILEDALSGIEGMDTMQSRSDSGDSRITLTFNLARDIESAVNDVRSKIGSIRNKLPQEATEPRIKKADADAVPIIHLALHSDRHTVEELADYAYRFLESQLEVIAGVSSVDIYGGGEYEMRIVLDPVKLANYRITADEVAAAIKKQNFEKPAGNIKTRNEEIVVTVKAPLTTENDFNNIILGERDGALLRLRNVGRATLATIDTKSVVRFNDQPAIAIGLTKQSVANPLTIAKLLNTKLPELRNALPQGMYLEVANDKTIFIDRSITEVYHTLFEATFLVIVVILLFLRSFRAIIIPIVTIPVSLIGTFFLMYTLGFSINILTLLALVLAIGMVVDDAIVMLENIYRYIEQGMDPMQAAFKGAKEISFAVIAMTITLAAVYAPIALSPGLTGKLFTEFALTLAGAVIISGFVALTLSPMMCGRLLRRHDLDLAQQDLIPNKKVTFQSIYARFDAKAELWLNKLETGYGNLLERLLNLRLGSLDKIGPPSVQFITSRLSGSVLMALIGLILAGLALLVGLQLKSEFLPREDQGILSVRMVPLTNNANLDFVNRYAKEADAIVKSIPEVDKRLSIIQVPGESNSLNLLVPWEKRARTTQEVAESIRMRMFDIVGLNVSPYSGGSQLGGGRSEAPFELVLKTTLTFEELNKKAQQAMKVLGRLTELRDVEADISSDAQEYVITIDREKAATLGVEIDQVASTLETLVGGKPVSKFKKDNKLFGVKIQVDEKVRSTVEDLTNIFLRGQKNRKEAVMVPLSEVITVEKKLSPVEISHIDGLRAITISARLKPGYGLGETLQKARQLIETEVADSSTQVDFAGESKRFLEEGRNIVEIFALSLAFIFLVLAAQYESWRDPWIIMLSVPLSLAGGVLFLFLFDQSLNLYSQIGFVTLVGLITKHGILIVDFANALKDEGLSRTAAVVKAARLRLRPILMTTFAMVLGAVPLAAAMGAGMESRRPIGLVIVGGMVIGTFFTLFIVPAVYTLISSKKAKQLPVDLT
jgi:multidrug efflux pump